MARFAADFFLSRSVAFGTDPSASFWFKEAKGQDKDNQHQQRPGDLRLTPSAPFGRGKGHHGRLTFALVNPVDTKVASP